MKYAIILPAYNEVLTIESVVNEFHRQLPEAEVWVIDNNSSDGTGDVARRLFQQQSIRGGVLHEPRQGKSFAVRKAFREVVADVYVMCDADATYSAADLPGLLNQFKATGVDMVVGNRFTKGGYKHSTGRRFHSAGNRLVRNLINLLFNGNLDDIMSGYRIMGKSLVKHFPSLNTGFELETELSIFSLERRFAILEYPVSYQRRPTGSFSKLNTYRDGFRVLKLIFFLFKTYRPLKFFGALSGVFFVAGIAAGLPVIFEFIQYHYVYKVPSAILASGLMVLSMHFFSLGIMMDSIARFHHQLFEVEMNKFVEESKRN